MEQKYFLWIRHSMIRLTSSNLILIRFINYYENLDKNSFNAVLEANRDEYNDKNEEFQIIRRWSFELGRICSVFDIQVFTIARNIFDRQGEAENKQETEVETEPEKVEENQLAIELTLWKIFFKLRTRNYSRPIELNECWYSQNV